MARSGQERNQSHQGHSDTPGRLPMFWVVRGHGQTDLNPCLKPATGRNHDERWWLEWILWWQNDASMIDATLQPLCKSSRAAM